MGVLMLDTQHTTHTHIILLRLFQTDTFRQPFSFRVLSSLPWGENKGLLSRGTHSEEGKAQAP